MSIDDDLGSRPTITIGDRSLSLFTDHYSFTRLLAERLNDPPKKDILFFHGAGGNGKSLLLKYLRTKICKGLTSDQWQRLKELKDEELAPRIEALASTQYLPVPTALLDFSPGSNRRDSDPFYGLVRIREELATSIEGTPYKLKFPLHTYGCFLYLHKTNRISEVDKLFPFEEAGLIKDFVGLVREVPTGIGLGLSALKLVDKYSGQRLTHYKRRFRLDEDAIQRLQRMDAESELMLELPCLLAQDLNVAMAGEAPSPHKPSRVLLLFDTHEAFYGSERNHAKNFFRDRWLRCLLRKLEIEAGIVVVVTGRDKPRWAEADKHELNTRIPADYITLKSVEDLAEGDAKIFLERAGVTDTALQKSLLHYASVEVERVHPLHLGLCVDVVLEAANKGVTLVPGDFSEMQVFQEKSDYLIEQLLKYVEERLRDAIWALSACRAFDFEIYQLLGEQLSFAVDRATFRQLVNFSFIRQVVQHEGGWYRIHDLLRRFGQEWTVVKAHELLAAHYQERREIESIYHVNRLDWAKGIELWLATFEEALKFSRYKDCRELLGLRQDLIICVPFPWGVISHVAGKYFQALAQYEAAKREYQAAITFYNLILETNSENVEALNSKGNSLRGLADSQRMLFEFEEARSSYGKSITAHNTALHQAPDNVQVLNSQGNSLGGLADLQATLSEFDDAQESYTEAIAAYDTALNQAPDNVQVLNSKGNSLRGLADLQSMLSEFDDAQESYTEAIAAYDTALNQAQKDTTGTWNNKGNSLQKLADLQAMLSKHVNAQESYTEAIAAYDTELKQAPDNVQALIDKGDALQKLAALQAMLSEFDDAQESYTEAIAVYGVALKQAPDDIRLLNNKGISLSKLSSLQVRLSKYDQARANHDLSIEAYDAALAREPDYVNALNNKGKAFWDMGRFQASQFQNLEAMKSFNAAAAAFRRSLEIAPNNSPIRPLYEQIVQYLNSQDG